MNKKRGFTIILVLMIVFIVISLVLAGATYYFWKNSKTLKSNLQQKETSLNECNVIITEAVNNVSNCYNELNTNVDRLGKCYQSETNLKHLYEQAISTPPFGLITGLPIPNEQIQYATSYAPSGCDCTQYAEQVATACNTQLNSYYQGNVDLANECNSRLRTLTQECNEQITNVVNKCNQDLTANDMSNLLQLAQYIIPLVG